MGTDDSAESLTYLTVFVLTPHEEDHRNPFVSSRPSKGVRRVVCPYSGVRREQTAPVEKKRKDPSTKNGELDSPSPRVVTTCRRQDTDQRKCGVLKFRV